MSSSIQYKKQIAYPPFFSRLLSALLDMTLLSFLSSPIMNYVGLLLFKFNFGEFAEINGLKLEGHNDISKVLQSDGFYENSASLQYLSFFAEYTLVQFILFSMYFILLWAKFGTTFGKFFFKIKIVDYKTQGKVSYLSALIRYLGYIFAPVSIIFIIFDPQRRTIHDKLANTLVIKN